jgi:peptidoglycan/LPS O-acetylase OafA/YrhL
VIQTSQYRSDIDGLRAFAVCVVLIFHAFPTLLPGGFVGVDVFFVISGYLITGIVLRDVQQERFSLRHFYAQRVRRIFPALTLVLLFCLGVGWLALTSGEYKQLGRYTAGGAAFLNNFLFWRDAGYFDNEADTKPLLHLWSLAIEEQFYLVWPVLLMALASAARRIKKTDASVDFLMCTMWLLGLLLLASLGFSLWQVQRDGVGNFYSPLSRAWELLVGAGLAAWAQRKAHEESRVSERMAEWLGWLGLALLLASLFVIHPARAFPGAWALLPTLGAACILQAGMASTVSRWLFASRPAVWLGLISYPLYLWHWPLLAFARIFEAQTPSVALRVGLLAASVVLAYATYRWVERPVRFGGQTPARARALLWVLCLGMLVFLFGGYAINRNDGLKFRHMDRLNADANSIVIGADRALLKRECGLPQSDIASFEWCLSQNKTTPARYAVVGDSKAEALYYGLARESRSDESVLLVGSITLAEKSARSRKVVERLKNDPNIDWVILSNTLVHAVRTNKKGLIDDPDHQEQLLQWKQNYSDLIDELTASGKRVALVLDNPTLPDPNSCIQGDMTPYAWLNHVIYRQANPDCRLSLKAHVVGTAAYRAFFEDLAKTKPSMLLFDTTPLLCDATADLCTYHEGRHFLYSYGNHISDFASSKLANQLLPLLRTAR